MVKYLSDYPSQFEMAKFYATAEALTLRAFTYKSPFKGVKVKPTNTGVSYVVEKGPTYIGTYATLQEAVEAYGAPFTQFKGPLCRLSEFLHADAYGFDFNPSVDYTEGLQAAWDYAKTQASELEVCWEIIIYDSRAEAIAVDERSRPVCDWFTPAFLVKQVAHTLGCTQLEYSESPLCEVYVPLSSIAFRAKEPMPE